MSCRGVVERLPQSRRKRQLLRLIALTRTSRGAAELLLRVRSALKSRLNKRDLDRALAYIQAVEQRER